MEQALSRGAAFLKSQIGPEGRCAGEPDPADRQYGGRTALCAYALISAAVSPKDPALGRALAWLDQAELKSVYAVAMRACACSGLSEPNTLPRLSADVRWLIQAGGPGGEYGYVPRTGKPQEDFDNCNAQAAVLAAAEAQVRGVEVPPAWWGRMERYWRDQQQVDGGWGYRALGGPRPAKTYGSMTAAGLAAFQACFDRLHQGDFTTCQPQASVEPIDRGLAWLGRRFEAGANPGIGENWHCFWLWCAARAGLAGGRKYFGAHDWYAEGTAELLRRQSSDGTWGVEGDLPETCFAMLFLCAGRRPILWNKLQYPGRWNARPQDAARLADWMSRTFERPVGWQVVEANSPLEDLRQAPVLYISGAGPIELDGRQVEALRTYVQQGGMILSEAACNSGEFSLDVQRLARRLFPQYPLERLADDHPVYSAHFSPKGLTGLMGASNGVRMLLVHCPRELSLGLQMGPTEVNLPWYELAANIHFLATDKMPPRPRGADLWPAERVMGPRAVIRVARIAHSGNADPEPLAWRRLALLLAERHQVKLQVSPPMPVTELDPNAWPVAAITGTAEPNWAAGELDALRRYLAGGGTLIADAAGGSRAFGQWVEKALLPLPPQPTIGPIPPEHDLYRRPERIDRAGYRRAFAQALGPAAGQPSLVGVQTGRRLAIIYSAEDLSCAMTGAGGYNIRGYSPESAVRLMTNIVCYAAGAALPAPPDSQPAAGPGRTDGSSP